MRPRYEDDMYEDDGDDFRPGYRPRPRKHSLAGVASFIIGLADMLWEFGLVATAGVLTASTPGGMDENSPVAMALGLGICAGLLGAVVGLILGIVGVMEQDRNKTFAVIGLTINGLLLLGVGVLILIGIAFG